MLTQKHTWAHDNKSGCTAAAGRDKNRRRRDARRRALSLPTANASKAFALKLASLLQDPSGPVSQIICMNDYQFRSIPNTCV